MSRVQSRSDKFLFFPPFARSGLSFRGRSTPYKTFFPSFRDIRFLHPFPDGWAKTLGRESERRTAETETRLRQHGPARGSWKIRNGVNNYAATIIGERNYDYAPLPQISWRIPAPPTLPLPPPALAPRTRVSEGVRWRERERGRRGGEGKGRATVRSEESRQVGGRETGGRTNSRAERFSRGGSRELARNSRPGAAEPSVAARPVRVLAQEGANEEEEPRRETQSAVRLRVRHLGAVSFRILLSLSPPSLSLSLRPRDFSPRVYTCTCVCMCA